MELKEFCDKVLNDEFDSEILVNRYTLWLEQKIIDLRRDSKFNQPTVSGSVCENVWCLGGKVFINGEQQFCHVCKDKQNEH